MVWSEVLSVFVYGSLDLVRAHGIRVSDGLLASLRSVEPLAMAMADVCEEVRMNSSSIPSASVQIGVALFCVQVRSAISVPVGHRREALAAECIRFSQRAGDHRKSFLGEAPFRLIFLPPEAYKILDVMHEEARALSTRSPLSVLAYRFVLSRGCLVV